MPRRWGQIRPGIGERDYVGGLRATGTNAKNRSTVPVPDAASRSRSDGSASRLASAVRRSRCIANCLSSRGNVASHLAGGRLLYRHVASVSSTVSKLLVQDVEHDAMRRADAGSTKLPDDAVRRQD